MSTFAKAVAIAAATLFTAVSAHAIQIDASYGIDANTGDGLIISTHDVAPNPFSFELNAGTPVTFDLFKIWTDEGSVNGDDKQPQPITVTFDFTSPDVFSGNVDGETVGSSSWLFFVNWQEGELGWNDPSTDFNFGANNDGLFRVTLSDESFNGGLYGLHDGYEMVSATFELIQDATPAAVPEPGSLALLGLGLAGLGMARRRLQ